MNTKLIKTIAFAFLPLAIQAQSLHNNGATFFVNTGAVLQVNGDMQTQNGSLFTNNGTVKVIGSVTNNQIMITPNTGTLEFNGTSAQSLNGSSEYLANDVLVNNALGVTLNTPLKVNGNITFSNGIVNAPSTSQAVLFTANGTHTNVSNASHILGYVIKEGLGLFTYPVGDGTHYEPIDIDLSANEFGMLVHYDTTDAGVAPYTTAGSNATPLVAVNHFEHWQVSPINTATGTVTMYWNAHNNIGIGNINDLRVAHLKNGNWQNEGAVTTSGNTTAGSVTSNSMSSWSPFTLGSIAMSSPLPVTLLSFTGKKETNANVLNWTTSQERNNAFFNVLKSQDGRNFSTLAKVNSKGESGNNEYELRDENPRLGHTYYRLQQVDKDGKLSNSQVVDLYRDATGNVVNVYPNPTAGMLNVECLHFYEGTTFITLSDLSGRIIKEINTTNKMTSIQMSDVAIGIYLLQVSQDNQVIATQKVEKK